MKAQADIDITSTVRRYLNFQGLVEYCRVVYSLPISRATVWRAQQAGRLIPRRVGGRLLYSIADVTRWIEGNEQPEGKA